MGDLAQLFRDVHDAKKSARLFVAHEPNLAAVLLARLDRIERGIETVLAANYANTLEAKLKDKTH